MVTPDLLDKLRSAHTEWHDTRGQSVATWLTLMAEDIHLAARSRTVRPAWSSPQREDWRPPAVTFPRLHADWEMIYHSADRFLVDGDHVVVIGACSWRYRPTGKAVESPIVQHWQFRDGLAVEYFEMYDTAKAFAATRPDPM